MTYITLTPETIGCEHICCAFSDKKSLEGYELKKTWLAGEIGKGYVFRRLDERAKVFIEYGPAETAWAPVTAPDYLMLGCFWVSGRHKGHGHGTALLQAAVADAGRLGKAGLVAVVGARQFHFMSDTRWLLRHGFEACDGTGSGFSLVAMRFSEAGERPHFNDCAKSGESPDTTGCVAYYSYRCPYTRYYVEEALGESCAKRGIPLRLVRLATMEQAQSAPTPATIFSLFLDGEFVTTDVSVCLDSRFDRIVGEHRAR